MTATVKINLDSPAAIKFLEYAATLPFTEIKQAKVAAGYPNYTAEELRARAKQTDADIAAGLFIPIEEVSRKTL